MLLVWPERGGILARRLDLVLLQRQAQRQRSQLALVTQDPRVRDHADLLGIPVFESTDRLSEREWRRGRRRSRSPIRVREAPSPAEGLVVPPRASLRVPAGLRRIVGAAALLSLFAAALAVLPSARVVLRPEAFPQRATYAFVLDSDPDGSAASDSLAAQRLLSRLSGEMRLATTGEVSVPTTYAAGEVVFVNLTSGAQTIPSGQSVRPAERQDLFFVTQQTVHLGPFRGARATASIRASVPGEAGNVSARQINAVDGPVGLAVSVTNPSPTAGGTDQMRAAAAAADRAAVYARLEADLIAQAEAQWRDSLPEDSLLAPGTAAVARVVHEQYSSEIGSPADSHALFLDVEIGALAYRRAALEASVVAALDQAIPDGLQPIPGSLQLEVLAPGSGGRLQVRAVRQVFRPPDRTALSRDLAAMPVADARRLLEAAGLAASPVILLHPPWFPTLPWSAVRIDVVWEWEAE